MKRRLFTILSGLSLLLCLACVGLWVRSYSTASTVGWVVERPDIRKTESWLLDARSASGGVAVCWESSVFPQARPAKNEGFYRDRSYNDGYPSFRVVSVASDSSQWTLLGVAWCAYEWSNTDTPYYIRIPDPGMADYTEFRGVVLPYWLLMAVSASLPGVWGWRRSKAKRHRKLGLCPICGYDLRVTPDRCPECGTVVRERNGGNCLPPATRAGIETSAAEPGAKLRIGV